MNILLTGATGYVGHELALALAAQENRVHIIVRNPASPNIPVHKNIVIFKGDITEPHTIGPAMNGCRQVYHTAALVKIFSKKRSQFYKVNVEGTNNLLKEAINCGIKKFVFTSTCGVLGSSVSQPKRESDPRTTGFNNEYEFTKSLAEKMVMDYSNKGLKTVIVSLSKVFGPGVETHPISVNRVIKRFLQGKPTFIPRPGTFSSNYCFIKDVVAGHILAMERGTSGEKYILGGENISYKDLFQLIRSLTTTKAMLIETPKVVVQLWAIFQWANYLLTGKEPIATLAGIKHIFCNKTFTSEKAINQVGYRVTPLKEALRQTIEYLKTHE
jgi:nucleoside-diphosphate-sugar epimerase